MSLDAPREVETLLGKCQIGVVLDVGGVCSADPRDLMLSMQSMHFQMKVF